MYLSSSTLQSKGTHSQYFPLVRQGTQNEVFSEIDAASSYQQDASKVIENPLDILWLKVFQIEKLYIGGRTLPA